MAKFHEVNLAKKLKQKGKKSYMNNKRGGKREGAGRKPKDTKQLSLKVSTKIIEDLNAKYPTVKERNIEIVKTLKNLSK